MSWRDPNWKYTNADETRKPNYLRDKFRRIQRDIEQQRQQAQTSVVKIREKANGK